MNKVNFEKREDGLGRKAFEIFAGLLILVFMGAVFWQMVGQNQTSDPDTTPVPEPVQSITTEEFKQQLEELVRIEIGQPIEGYEPAMFMQVLPGLTPEDFNDVEAEIGVYKYRNGELKHEIPQDILIHSAAAAVTEKGIETLIANISKRMEVNLEQITTDEVIKRLSGSDMDTDGTNTDKPVACTADAKICPDGSAVGRVGPNCDFAACSGESVDSFEDCVAAGNPVMESYPRQCNHNGQHFVENIFPIRYGEDVSNVEEYRADCESKMGVFNECASACGPEAEICEDVCSMVCTGPAEEHIPTIPPDVNPDDVTFCSPQQKEAMFCTMEYAPVCGFTEVQCITEPCEPVKETYGNACGACAAGVDYYINDSCTG